MSALQAHTCGVRAGALARLFGERWRPDARPGGQISGCFRDEKKETTIVTVLTAAVKLEQREGEGGGVKPNRQPIRTPPRPLKGW